MLSRDEQALDMARVICREEGTRKCVDGKCSRLLHCPARISIFEALIDAGYGDVAEYKAEIERLNEELKKPQEQFVQDEKDHEEGGLRNAGESHRRGPCRVRGCVAAGKPEHRCASVRNEA